MTQISSNKQNKLKKIPFCAEFAGFLFYYLYSVYEFENLEVIRRIELFTVLSKQFTFIGWPEAQSA
jgi:hypothetical protein